MTSTVRSVLCAVFALVGVGIAPTPSHAQLNEVFIIGFDKLALRGFDPVAYFTEGRAVEGRDAYTLEWKGGTWKFATAANRAAFEADPAAYAPQYGGYCAYAVAQGATAAIDPEAWTIVDGKLYLNFSKQVRDTWRQDIPGYIQKADANWPGVLGR